MSNNAPDPAKDATSTTLLVDLGGTNVRFALCDPTRDPPLLADSIRRYHVDQFASLTAAARQYLQDGDAHPQDMLIAAAGPVSDDQTVKITNHPWTIRASTLQEELKLRSVRLINDFAAQSMAPTLLGPDGQAAVGGPLLPAPGKRPVQTFAVVGPGTGLGVGALLVRDGHPSALESEGGHTGFAPTNATELDILQRLTQRYGRVSNERVLCGQGLVNLYETLCAMAGQTPEQLKPEDITRRADRGGHPLCVRTVETLVGIFGSVAGDFVLALGAWDGVYLTGGLMPTLLPWLQRGSFRERFEAKGRFNDAMRKVPTAAITAAESGLLGAAATALHATADTKLRTHGADRQGAST